MKFMHVNAYICNIRRNKSKIFWRVNEMFIYLPEYKKEEEVCRDKNSTSLQIYK